MVRTRSAVRKELRKKLRDAQTVARAKWRESIFTSLVMLQWCLEKSGRSWEHFIEHPNFDESRDILLQAIDNATSEDLYQLWANGTGTCTCWPISVIDGLQKRSHKTAYIYGEKESGHRAAWSDEGIVLDSSARRPFLLSHPNEEYIFNATRWKMDNIGTVNANLYSVKGNGQKMESFTRLSGHVEAMRKSLRHMVDQTDVLEFYTLYRRVSGQKFHFNGMTKWTLSTDKSEIIVSQIERDGVKSFVRATFFKASNPTETTVEEEAARLEARSRFCNFHRMNGRSDQFTKIEPIFNQIMSTCKDCYGPATYEKGGKW